MLNTAASFFLTNQFLFNLSYFIQFYLFILEFKQNQENESLNSQKPPHYIRIKVNKPVGNVRVFDMNLSNTTACECDPNKRNPCGPDSDCLNR